MKYQTHNVEYNLGYVGNGVVLHIIANRKFPAAGSGGYIERHAICGRDKGRRNVGLIEIRGPLDMCDLTTVRACGSCKRVIDGVPGLRALVDTAHETFLSKYKNVEIVISEFHVERVLWLRRLWNRDQKFRTLMFRSQDKQTAIQRAKELFKVEPEKTVFTTATSDVIQISYEVYDSCPEDPESDGFVISFEG